MTSRQPKVVFIGNIAAPIQVKFCYALQRYYDATFLFHEHLNKNRPEWWRIELGPKCSILRKVVTKRRGLYLSLDILPRLRELNPDIILLGGFKMPSNLLAYRWAKCHGKHVVVFSESFRRRGRLRGRSPYFRLLEAVYGGIDGPLSSNDGAYQQFERIFPVFRGRTHHAQYPSDIDHYYSHPYRQAKPAYTYLFANRQIEIYNPHLAVKVFAALLAKYPGSVLRMNAQGELVESTRQLISVLGIGTHVEFLSSIRSWDEMHLVYRDSDILLLPATFSNGNFSVVEAMVSGMGIIISDKVLWNRDMIQTGKNGYVCEPALDSFVGAAENYVANPSLFREHCVRNREIGRRFTMAATADLFHQILQRCAPDVD